MPRKIILRWDDPKFERLPTIRDMGEELWHALQDSGVGSADIAEIDAARDHFVVLTPTRTLGAAMELIRAKLRRYNLLDVVRVERD